LLDGAAVSPQAAGVRSADQENAQVLYCGDEVDANSRTLLDYHPVEAMRADFCAERADVALARLVE
jgi:hypothetical protein